MRYDPKSSTRLGLPIRQAGSPALDGTGLRDISWKLRFFVPVGDAGPVDRVLSNHRRRRPQGRVRLTS
jgi:hypothetical protein